MVVRSNGGAGLCAVQRRLTSRRASALKCRRQQRSRREARLEQVWSQASTRIEHRPGAARCVPATPPRCCLLACPPCPQVQRNCVVLPCLHFLYCDSCFKQHCATSPSCPACNCAVTGFQALIMHR